MTVENAQYISQLDATNPDGDVDSKAEGDDHLKLIKAVLLACFPHINGVVSASAAELSALVGALSSGSAIRVQTQVSGDSSTKAASTAFVQQALASAVVGLPPFGAANEQYTLQVNGGLPAWGLGSPLTYLTLQNQGII